MKFVSLLKKTFEHKLGGARKELRARCVECVWYIICRGPANSRHAAHYLLRLYADLLKSAVCRCMQFSCQTLSTQYDFGRPNTHTHTHSAVQLLRAHAHHAINVHLNAEHDCMASFSNPLSQISFNLKLLCACGVLCSVRCSIHSLANNS